MGKKWPLGTVTSINQSWNWCFVSISQFPFNSSCNVSLWRLSKFFLPESLHGRVTYADDRHRSKIWKWSIGHHLNRSKRSKGWIFYSLQKHHPNLWIIFGAWYATLFFRIFSPRRLWNALVPGKSGWQKVIVRKQAAKSRSNSDVLNELRLHWLIYALEFFFLARLIAGLLAIFHLWPFNLLSLFIKYILAGGADLILIFAMAFAFFCFGFTFLFALLRVLQPPKTTNMKKTAQIEKDPGPSSPLWPLLSAWTVMVKMVKLESSSNKYAAPYAQSYQLGSYMCFKQCWWHSNQVSWMTLFLSHTYTPFRVG